MSKFYDRATDPVFAAIDQILGGPPELVEQAAHAARDACSREIIAHADQRAPKDGTSSQQRMRRHWYAAVQVISPKPSADQVLAAMRQYFEKEGQ